MTIKLLTTKDENIKLEKTYTELVELLGNVRNKNEIGTKTLHLTIETSNDDVIQTCNYVYVEDIDRYYFVLEKQSIVTGVWVLTCKLDPLMSFASQIRECRGILKRNANKVDYYVQDQTDICYQNPYVVYKNFPSGFDGDKASVILITT